MTSKQWGVLVAKQLKQNHKPVKESLEKIGVENFVPLIDNVTVVSGRHVHRVVPLFGRYIFFVVNEVWKSISGVQGVSGLMLTSQFNPAIVEHDEMRALQSVCVNSMYQSKEKPAVAGLVYGQRVTPTSGPLEHRVGTYDGIRSRDREAALFNLFGREQKVVFKTGELIAAGSS